MRLDHLVFGGPDLAAAVDYVRQLTGVQASRGGRHTGKGTANYLIGLGPAAYLEIIGPDPCAADGPGWFGLQTSTAPRLLTWATRADDVDAAIATARGAGYDPGPAATMSRQSDRGAFLQWHLTPDTVKAAAGVIPFLIDWGHSAHPSRGDLPQLRLASVSATSAHPAQDLSAVEALGEQLDIRFGPTAGLTAVLATPSGLVTLA
jgi:hypothetical protein